jgi:hypothetical protein
MFPFRYKTIFKNRWYAVLWAAGMIWFAVDVAERSKPEPAEQEQTGTDGAASPETDEQVAQLQRQVEALQKAQ